MSKARLENVTDKSMVNFFLLYNYGVTLGVGLILPLEELWYWMCARYVILSQNGIIR